MTHWPALLLAVLTVGIGPGWFAVDQLHQDDSEPATCHHTYSWSTGSSEVRVTVGPRSACGSQTTTQTYSDAP